MQKVSGKIYWWQNSKMDNEYTTGLLKTPLVPEGVNTEALDPDVYDEDGF